jgi:hypothetical protein
VQEPMTLAIKHVCAATHVSGLSCCPHARLSLLSSTAVLPALAMAASFLANLSLHAVIPHPLVDHDIPSVHSPMAS